MKKQISLYIFLIFILSSPLRAQIGGQSTYGFLDLPNSASVGALGGINLSLPNDLNMVYHNPALLNSEMSHHLALNYINYISDINYGYASYAYHLDDVGSFAGGVHYINYGDFIRADETGNILGNFTASEYSFNLYYARPLDAEKLWNVGASLKTVYSEMDHYYSSALLLDAGINYRSSDEFLSASFVVKNLGFQLKPYYPGHREPMPFDMQVGATYKLPHAPFRISAAMQHLLKWNMRYESEFEPGSFVVDEDSETEDNFFDKAGNAGDEFLRHLVLGIEIMPSDNFFIAAGYNYQRRTELSIQTRPGLTGFSIGAGVRISKFRLSYAYAMYHLGGASSHITLTSNLADFYRRKS